MSNNPLDKEMRKTKKDLNRMGLLTCNDQDIVVGEILNDMGTDNKIVMIEVEHYIPPDE